MLGDLRSSAADVRGDAATEGALSQADESGLERTNLTSVNLTSARREARRKDALTAAQ
jgi:hypothetical protein